MGQPELSGNFRAYEDSDVVRRAKQFKPGDKSMRKLFLVHGTRDDNVHLQHSLVLAKELVRLGIDFRQQVDTTEREKLQKDSCFIIVNFH